MLRNCIVSVICFGRARRRHNVINTILAMWMMCANCAIFARGMVGGPNGFGWLERNLPTKPCSVC
jgi:hypothetical protein